MTFAQDCTGHTAFSGYGVDSASGKNDIGSLITCGGFRKKKKTHLLALNVFVSLLNTD